MALSQNTGRKTIATFLLLANGQYSAVLHYIQFNISYPLRWLNTVLRAVSGNSRDGACFN